MNQPNIKIDDQIFTSLCRIGDQIQSAFVITNASLPTHPILYVNDMFTQLTGYEKEEVVGDKSVLFKTAKEKKTIVEILAKVRQSKVLKTEFVSYKKDGTPFINDVYIQAIFDGEGNHVYNVSYFLDKTSENSLKGKSEIEKLAYIDSISGLPNYNYFIRRFPEMVKAGNSGFLLLIQLTDYVSIVDSYGKQMFGKIHYEIAERIKNSFQDLNFCISQSTEGSLIVLCLCKEKEMEQNVLRLFDITKEPIVFNNDFELYFSLRLGLVSLKYYEGNVDDFVRKGDIALSNTRHNVGNSIAYYDSSMSEKVKRKMQVQTELIHALRKKEIYVHLQPKVNINTGKIHSFEALARWYSPKLGQVRPDIFIQAAEAIGLIEEVDLQVTEQVLKWLKDRKERNLPLYQVSVNVSPVHFYMSKFIPNLTSLLEKYDIDPYYIKIELTENIGLVDIDLAKKILRELIEKGFEISVDDFGKGFSSLNYLHELPIKELKIDRTFLLQLENINARKIVSTIIQLASNMGIFSVAEGVETREQISTLRKMGSYIAQGYYFYKPMSFEEINDILLNE